MIKKRLLTLLSHGKKYIFYNVLWQWIALLFQIAVIFSAAGLLEKAAFGNVRAKDVGVTLAVVLAALVMRFVCDKMAARASYHASVDLSLIHI